VTYRVAIIFLLLYFVRPQDWVPGMAGLNIIRPLMAVGLISLFTGTPPISRQKLVATPIDWMMLVYLAYLAYTSPDLIGAIKQLIPILAFYYVTVLSLTDKEKLCRYLYYWLAALILVTIAGLLTQFGIDFTNAGEQIQKVDGRLLINTWLLNNPNSLGHTVVIALPLAYLLVWWKRNPVAKMLAVGLAIVAFQCAVYTQSKGAFLAGAGLLMVGFTFGRPIWVQGIALTLALSMGIGGLMYLPRMSGMANLRADEGVLGRILAWEVAQTAYYSSATGAGWKQFSAEIEWEGQKYPKATHSSYVKAAADLGPIGLFFYLSLICLSLRALIQYPGLNTSMERTRRAIFVLLAALCISGWMIDRPYHTEYFLVMAVAAAYLRLSLEARSPKREEHDAPVTAGNANPMTPPQLQPFGVNARSGDRSHASLIPPLPVEDTARPRTGNETRKKLWRRYGWLDLVIGIAALKTVEWLWEYILQNI
jgi:O-antigen ligase